MLCPPPRRPPAPAPPRLPMMHHASDLDSCLCVTKADADAADADATWLVAGVTGHAWMLGRSSDAHINIKQFTINSIFMLYILFF